MKTAVLLLLVAALLVVYGATLVAVLHPHITAVYKACYVEHTSYDCNPSHYAATPEEGIVFSRPGLPEWVQFTRGLSSRDNFGRWTDEDLGSVAGLVFNQSFSGPVCVQFTSGAVPWVVGKTLTVRMGGETQKVRITDTGLTTYWAQFTNVGSGDSLDLLLPEKLPRVSEVTPSNRDRRRVALALATLRITTGECPVH